MYKFDTDNVFFQQLEESEQTRYEGCHLAAVRQNECSRGVKCPPLQGKGK